jgi:hypothetical protein
MSNWSPLYFLIFASMLLFCYYFFFVLKDSYELKQKKKREQETGERRRQIVCSLIEEFQAEKKRACFGDEQVISWLKVGLGLDGLFGIEEGQIDCSAFRHWLKTSVYRARTKGSIEAIKDSKNILHPDSVDGRFVEILAHCEAFGFQLEEFGITRSELEGLMKKKIVEWGQSELERCERESARLEEDRKKVMDILLERDLVAPVLGEKFARVSLPKSEQ